MTSPENFTADKLIAAHDGDVALLYIWLGRHGGFDAEQAAQDLCRTAREIDAAWEKLERMGLAPEVPAADPIPPEPARELPQYNASDLVRGSADGNFKEIVNEAQRTLGRVLSSADLKILFGIYDYLKLPKEVIFLLLNFCVEMCEKRYGPGRRPSMRSIEKQAYTWASDEILTLDQAEAYVADAMRRQSLTGKIMEALSLRGRAPTASEAKYIDAWIDMGFDENTLSIAYDRTVTNTGGLKWPYMNKIVQSWHQKGLHSPEEITGKDRKNTPNTPSGDGSDNIEHLKAVLDKVKRS